MPGRTLYVECKSCGTGYEAPASMKGGKANCPDCGTANDVGGGIEPLFWALLGMGVLLVFCASGFFYWLAGWGPAALVLVTGVIVLGVIVSLS